MSRKIYLPLVGLTLALLGYIVATELSPAKILASQAEAYFETPTAQGSQFHELGHDIYAYQHEIDVGLVIRTAEGLVVLETFDSAYVEALRKQLELRFPGEPITHLIYSHHHLDHVRGGHELGAREVWAHENTRWHFERTPEDVVLRPTRYLEPGDRTLTIGGRRIDLIDFDHAHGQHLYAFLLPDADLLYAPDLAFCQTLPPFGFPDFNHQGHVEALQRAAALDFDRFIPSHFGLGDKRCVVENLALYTDIRSTMERGLETHGLPVGQGQDWFVSMLNEGDAELSEKYGHWHGYEQMGTPFLLRQLSGSFIGF